MSKRFDTNNNSLPMQGVVSLDEAPGFFERFRPELYRDFYVSGQDLRSVTFNNSGSKICTLQSDSLIRIWTADKPDLKTSVGLKDAHERMVESVSWNPLHEDEILSCGSSDRKIKLWDGKNKTLIKEFNTEGPNSIVRYSHDGKYIAIGMKDGTVKIISGDICESTELQVIGTLKERPNDIYDIAWSNSSNIFCAALGSGSVRVCRVIPPDELEESDKNNIDRVKVMLTLRGHRTAANTLAFDPKGKYLAVGTNEGIISLWDVHEWICEKTLSMFDQAIMDVSFSHDGNYIAVAMDTNVPIEIVHIDTVTAVKTFKRQNWTYKPSLAWNPRKYYLAATGDQYGMTVFKHGDR